MSGRLTIERVPRLREYTANHAVTLSMKVTNEAGALVDPSDLTVTVQRPDGTANTYTYSGAQITRTGTGLYSLAVTLDQADAWRVRAQATGTVSAAAFEEMVCFDAFPVPPSPTSPGSAYAGQLAVVGPSGTYLPVGGTSEGDDIKYSADSNSPTGFSWQKRRGWIEPDIDLAGNVGASTRLQAALNSSRPGACVYISDGTVLLDGAITVPQGRTLCGPEQGMTAGHRVFPGVPNVGTLLNVTHTGKAFTPAQQARICNFTIYYPNQKQNATPDVYDWTFYLDANAHQVTIQNIAAINPYNFLRQGSSSASARISDIVGFPLHRGIQLGRVPGSTRISNVEFNPAVDYQFGATLKAYVASQGAAYVVGSAEEFMFSSCFAYGYSIGMWLVDAEGDNFRGGYGSWTGGGLDLCHRGVLVDSATMLTARGFRMSNTGIVGDGAGAIGFLFSDTHVPANVDERPAIYGTNVNVWNADFGVEMGAGSYGVYSQVGGSLQTSSTMAVRDGANSKLVLNMVLGATAATRTGGAGAAGIVDLNPILG